MKEIQTPQELFEFAQAHGLREDWHEPDEQDIDVTVSGTTFDNAGLNDEMTVKLYAGPNGPPVAQVNLATLCAWAAQFGRISADIDDGFAPNI